LYNEFLRKLDEASLKMPYLWVLIRNEVLECRLYPYGEDAESAHGKDDDVGPVCQQLNIPEQRS